MNPLLLIIGKKRFIIFILFWVSFILFLTLSVFRNQNEVFAINDLKKGKIENKDVDTGPNGGEKWVEEDDEQFYKFDIHPITPKEGITTGVVIYFGHYIRPPYKVEARGEGWDTAVYINGLQVDPAPKNIIEKLDQRNNIMRDRRQINEGISLSKEEEKNIHSSHEVLMEVDNYYRDLLRKYKLSDEGKKQIYSELKNYLSNHPLIDHYRLKSVFNFSYHVKGLSIFDWENYTIDDPEELLRSDEEKQAEKLKRRVYYTKLSVDNIIYSLRNSGCIYLSRNISDLWMDELQGLSIALNSNLSNKNKVAKIYQILGGPLENAKYFYYNFNNSQFKSDFGKEK